MTCEWRVEGRGWHTEDLWMTRGDRAVSMWMACRRREGDMYLAPEGLHRGQATALPLRLPGGECKRPRVRLGGGPAAARPSTHCPHAPPELPGVRLSPLPERSVSCLTAHSESSRGSLHPVSGTDTLTHPVAPSDASFSFTPPPTIAKVPHNSLSR